MDPYLRDVLDVLLRMLYVIAGIAWIGASFYSSAWTRAPPPEASSATSDAAGAGEFLGVHGGGLYHAECTVSRPREMLEPLDWFQWGRNDLALGVRALVVLSTSTRRSLSTRQVADLDDWQAIAY